MWPDFLPALLSGRGVNTGQSATACVCSVWARTAEHNPRVLRSSLLTNRDQMEICSTVSPAPHISLSATLSFKPQVSLEQGLTRTGWLLTHPVDACLMPMHQQFCAPGTTVRAPWGPGGAATALLSTAGPHTHTQT